VRQFFHKRTLGRRVVALVAAYAIALASLLATFSAARAAVDTNNNLGVICHSVDSSRTVPGGQDDGQACANNCCIGCLMLTAALPPPPVKVSGAPQIVSEPLPPPATAAFAAGTFTKSHRSRAPPLPA
jgi:hypothetical protein